MQKASSLQGKRWSVSFLLTASLILAADQLSKMWIRSNLLVGESLFEIGFFRLTHIHNTGAAFGVFRDQTFFLTIVALVGAVCILIYTLLFYRRYPFLPSILGTIALGLVLGGTVGNLVDRLRLGYVTDFIDVGFWPAFNVADPAIVVGVGILAYSLLFLTVPRKRSEG